MDEMSGILEAVKTGGSAATLALAYFGWKLFGSLKEGMKEQTVAIKEQSLEIKDISERLARFEGKMDARDDRNETRTRQ